MTIEYDPEYGWACAWTDGRPRPFIIIQTTRSTRSESCECIGTSWKRDGETNMQGWRRAYRQGCRCIRVQVSQAFYPGLSPSDFREPSP